MSRMLRVVVICLIVAVASVTMLIMDADAQNYITARPGGRAGTWDFFMPLTYNPSWTIHGKGGSSVDLNETWGFGFGFGYNLSDHFQLNGLFSWSARNYNATLVNTDGTTRRYGNTEYSSTFSINGIFYLLSGDISPFVSGGVGWTYIDTGIQNGQGSTTCWWDPWYGYVCSGGYPTKTESDWTYNVGVGVRFDLGRSFSLQPSYNKAWANFQNATGSTYFDIWRLDFIFRM